MSAYEHVCPKCHQPWAVVSKTAEAWRSPRVAECPKGHRYQIAYHGPEWGFKLGKRLADGR